jgi:predicted AAA+ superfamily ATPase
MSNTIIKPWIEVVSFHPDVISEDFSEDVFALDLGPLADGKPTVPPVYRDPEHFFGASYITKGLRSLLEDVLSRLSGGKGNRVLNLAPLRSAIGMLEYWNDGIMGSGKMG